MSVLRETVESVRPAGQETVEQAPLVERELRLEEGTAAGLTGKEGAP